MSIARPAGLIEIISRVMIIGCIWILIACGILLLWRYRLIWLWTMVIPRPETCGFAAACRNTCTIMRGRGQGVGERLPWSSIIMNHAILLIFCPEQKGIT